MGVVTTADEKRDKAKELIQEAYLLLQEVVDPETYGNSEYSESYVEKVEECLADLRKMKRKL